MAFSLGAKLTAVYNAVNNANTTTASFDLSTGLATRIQNIEMNDPEVRPARDIDHPFLWVWIDRNEQNFDEIGVAVGQGITKRMRMNYKILATIHKAGMVTAHSTALNEIYKLADNIMTVFQTEYTLSGTALWAIPKSVEFLPPVGQGGNYIKGAIIDLEAEYLFR